MLERLSKRLSSVAAPDPSSQSKDMASGRALNTADTVWVGASSELADFVAALSAYDLTKAMAMLGDPEPRWAEDRKRFATIMKRNSIGFAGSELKEKDASPAGCMPSAVGRGSSFLIRVC